MSSKTPSPTDFPPFKTTLIFYKRILQTLNKKREFENTYPILFSELLRFKAEIGSFVKLQLVKYWNVQQTELAEQEVSLFLKTESFLERLLDACQCGKMKITQQFMFDHIFANYGINISSIQHIYIQVKEKYAKFLKHYDQTFQQYECDVFQVFSKFSIAAITTEIDLEQLYTDYLILEAYAASSTGNPEIQYAYLSYMQSYTRYPAFLFTDFNQAFTEVNISADPAEYNFLGLNVPLIEDTTTLAQTLSSFLVEFYVHKSSFDMSTAKTDSDIAKSTQQAQSIIDLLWAVEPILNKNTKKKSDTNTVTYKEVRGEMVALLYHDFNRTHHTVELEQFRLTEKLEADAIILDTNRPSEKLMLLKQLKADYQKKYDELVKPIDGNQFMRYLCSVINSNSDLTAQTLPLKAKHVNAISYKFNKFEINSLEMSKDNITTGVKNYRKKLHSGIARFLIT
ncbi:hypothetical protein [Acinetobacter johnsonii]|uniref:hypothetical protein n=1 Tax=Acinetobacter johnsonii TaxID=40214 RepID=UPI001F3682C3|nr:hypothetical protein [Acinetobacter johnsonii]UJA01824.1 hypothetical protein GBN93_13105 [Acinetobacter johnsonii]